MQVTSTAVPRFKFPEWQGWSVYKRVSFRMLQLLVEAL